MKNFQLLRRKAGLSIEDCVKVFDVHRRTVKNWEKGSTTPPKAVFLYLAISVGELDFLGSAWSGFKILPDCIVSPEGDHIWHYEVRALRYVYAAAGLQRYEVCNTLKHQNCNNNDTGTLAANCVTLRPKSGLIGKESGRGSTDTVKKFSFKNKI